ncbi:MAG: type II toxin-antitoxin system death-on-curing family toxin [Myxococcaceae bacterium]
MSFDFLSVEEVLELHRLQLERYGGAPGLRDFGLLESAVAQPAATFEAEYLHDGLYAMAAAYLYHLVKNHPLVDANHRTGLVAALVFLELNGVSIGHGSEELYALTVGVAEDQVPKDEVTRTLERLAKAPAPPRRE